MPRDQTCRQRCYFGRRLLDQTKHSGETAEPNKCLPHILGHLCNSPRSWYASPRLAGSYGLAPVHAHGRCPVWLSGCRCSKQDTASEWEWAQAMEEWRAGGRGDWVLGIGHLAMGSASGKERGWCIEHCRRHAHALRCPGLARQSQRRIHHGRLVWVLSSAGPITRWPVVRQGVTSLDPFLGISSRPHGNATDCCPTGTRRRCCCLNNNNNNGVALVNGPACPPGRNRPTRERFHQGPGDWTTLALVQAV